MSMIMVLMSAVGVIAIGYAVVIVWFLLNECAIVFKPTESTRSRHEARGSLTRNRQPAICAAPLEPRITNYPRVGEFRRCARFRVVRLPIPWCTSLDLLSGRRRPFDHERASSIRSDLAQRTLIIDPFALGLMDNALWSSGG